MRFVCLNPIHCVTPLLLVSRFTTTPMFDHDDSGGRGALLLSRFHLSVRDRDYQSHTLRILEPHFSPSPFYLFELLPMLYHGAIPCREIHLGLLADPARDRAWDYKNKILLLGSSSWIMQEVSSDWILQASRRRKRICLCLPSVELRRNICTTLFAIVNLPVSTNWLNEKVGNLESIRFWEF